MKIKYEWVLFDADDTLFNFDIYNGLKHTLSHYDAELTQSDFDIFKLENKKLWLSYQNSEITAEMLQHSRFNLFAKKLNLKASDLNETFLAIMGTISKPLVGATDLLNALFGKSKLGIITNGFTKVQTERLALTGLHNHFDLLVISEEVGVAKPNIEIFEHALSKMGNPSRDQVLMVGDNADTDIRGGINAKLHTCWLNVDGKTLPSDLSPTYQVTSLTELYKLLI